MPEKYSHPPSPEHYYGATLTEASNNFLLRHGGVDIEPNRNEWIKNQYDSAYEYAKEHNDDEDGVYVELHKTKQGEYIPIVAIEDMSYYGSGSFGMVSEFSGHNLAQIYHDEETSDDERFAGNRPKLASAGFYGLISETGIGEYRSVDPAPPPIVRGRLRDEDGRKIVSIKKSWLSERGKEGMSTGELVYAFAHLNTDVELIGEDETITKLYFEGTSEIMSITNRTDFVSIPKERRFGHAGKPIMALGAIHSSVRTKNDVSDDSITIREGVGLRFDWLEGYARRHSDLYETAGIKKDMFGISLGSDFVKIGGNLDYLDDKDQTPRVQMRIECGSEALDRVGSDVSMIRDSIDIYFRDLYGKAVAVTLLHRQDEDHVYKLLDMQQAGEARA